MCLRQAKRDLLASTHAEDDAVREAKRASKIEAKKRKQAEAKQRADDKKQLLAASESMATTATRCVALLCRSHTICVLQDSEMTPMRARDPNAKSVNSKEYVCLSESY